MDVKRGIQLRLPRGHAAVDVLAKEAVQGIEHSIICECKDWSSNVPQEKVHAFRTIMHETGANRGYIITRKGFQAGAILAAESTNIELVTYGQFQERYFAKWFDNRIRAIEESVGNFDVYYEPGPCGKCGYDLLTTDRQRAEYDEVWNKYFFAGILLMYFSPYRYMMDNPAPPPLPLDVTRIEAAGFFVPDDIKRATGYREVLALLEGYARVGLRELRALNPRRNGTQGVEQIEELDAPIPRSE